MAIMKDPTPQKNVGEKRTYKCIEENLPDSVMAYYNREVNGLEFDFCLLIEDMCMAIIEVKGWEVSNILNVDSPDEIYTNIYPEPVTSPKKQARAYRFSLLNKYNNKYNVNPLILDMVCYPFISEKEYRKVGLDIVSEPETTLFKEDIESKVAFSKKISRLYQQRSKTKHDKMTNALASICRSNFENSLEALPTNGEKKDYSILRIIPDGMTLADVEEILKSYFLGQKNIIFVSSQSELEVLRTNLQISLDKKGVRVIGSNLVIDEGAKNSISLSDSSINIFNLTAFCIDEISSFSPQRIQIDNGKIDNNSVEVLQKLAEKTTFNYQQYSIEHAPVGRHLQIRAGAGTGKTFSMISRISYLCHVSDGVNPLELKDEIAMLTFTTDAASNMKNRLKRQFMNYFILTNNAFYLDIVGSVERMSISTIHSFTSDVIKNTALPLGIGIDFSTVSGTYEKQQIFIRNFNEYLSRKTKEDPDFLIDSPISMYDLRNYALDFADLLYRKGCDIKDTSVTAFGNPIAIMPCFNEIIIDVIKKTEIDYSEHLKNNNEVSLNEYMFYLNKCIADDAFNNVRYKFKYLFIDEFQDVDDSQIKAFVAMQKKIEFKLFIVGDLKQSIYRFRGATMDAFTKMGCDESEWLTYTLNTNYRTDKGLLYQYDDLFNRMGEWSLLPYQKEFDALYGVHISEDGQSTKAQRIVYSKNDEKEGRVNDILFELIEDRRQLLAKKAKACKLSISERTIAILTRTNYQARLIMNAAKARGVVVESDSSGDLYRIDPAIDLCKLTAAICNPYNATILYDFILSNNVNIEISLAKISGLDEYTRSKILVDCLDEFFLSMMSIRWTDLIAKVQTEPVLMILRRIYETTRPWKTYSANKERQEYYRNNYDLIFENMTNLNKKGYLTIESINEILHIMVNTGTEEKSREINHESDEIRVLCTTVHKSKGLEYDTIIIPFTSDKIDELKRTGLDITYVNEKVGYCLSLDNNQYNNKYFYVDNERNELRMEESRILYVAMTRAINRFIWFEREADAGESWGSIMRNMECQ